MKLCNGKLDALNAQAAVKFVKTSGKAAAATSAETTTSRSYNETYKQTENEEKVILTVNVCVLIHSNGALYHLPMHRASLFPIWFMSLPHFRNYWIYISQFN